MRTKLNPITPCGCHHPIRRPVVTFSLLLAFTLAGQNIRAGDSIWTGASVPGNLGANWLTAGNWSPEAVPGISDNAVFNGTALTNNCYLDMGAAGGTLHVGSLTLIPNQGANILVQNSSATDGILVLHGVGGILLSNNYGLGGEMIIENGSAGGSLGLGLASSGAIYASGALVASKDPGRVEVYSVISDFGGSHGVTLTGPGNVYFRGANTYSGDTVILNGAMELDTVGTAGNGAGTIYLSGGNIQSGASRNGYNTGTFIPNPIVLTADAHIFNTASTANSTRYIPFSGPLSGSAGSLIICNPTTVSGNYFVPRFSGSFTFNRPLIIGDNYSGSEFEDNTLSYSAVDMCNAATNGAQTWAGTISGPGSVRRSSPTLSTAVPGGVAVLTGNNTYSGGTTINNGSLFANNTSGSALGSGAVTVTNSGTLGGSGAVIAPTIVSSGGTIQPGASSATVGKLVVDSLTLGPGANYNWQISSASGAPGTAWDLIICSSGWLDAGTSGSTNVIHLSSLGAPTGWNSATAYTWLILSNNPAFSPGFNAANWAVDTKDFGGAVSGTFTLSTDSNGSLDLVYTPSPNSNPVAHMLMLAPGESPAYGSAPGKSGSPSAQFANVGYSVTVQALDAGYNLCSNSLDAVAVISSAPGDTLPAKTSLVHGSVTFALTNNTAGNITLTATNVAQGPVVAAGSSIVPVNVNSTTTTMTTSANPAGEGVLIAFTASVLSGAGTPTGTVTFKNGTEVLGTVPLAGNSAVLTISGGQGIYSITATYNGDADNSASTSTPLAQVIQAGAGGSQVVGPAKLMEDGQDYPLASSTPITGRGPWVCGGGTGSTSYIKILAGDLSGATSPDIGPLTNTVNPEAKLQVAKAGTNSRWYYRSLSNNVTAGSVYFSFLLNVTVNPTTDDEFMGAMQAGGVNTSPAPTDPLTLHARVGTDGSHFSLGIERLNGDTVWTDELADNTTYLVVLKYTFGSSAACSLYINPTPGKAEPAPTVSAFGDSGTPEPASIGTVLFYEAGSVVTYLTSGTYQYDVMRADTNWLTVTPTIVSGLLGPTRLLFIPAAQSIPVNQNSALITVNLLQSNSTFNATSDTVVALSSTSGGGTFLSAVDGTTVINSVTISSGSSSASFYYRDSAPGNPTITAASGLLTPATQTETITGAGAPPNFPPGSIARLASGNISLTATGAVSTPYRLWATTNLALQPVTSTWTLISSGTITASPFTNYDLTATNFSKRFYLFTSP